MYLTDFENFFSSLEQIDSINFEAFFMVSKNTPFQSLLIQNIKRNLNNEEISFLAIRDFKLLPEFQNKGIFTKTISIIESKKIPFMVDDIINPKLDVWLSERKYIYLETEKYSHVVKSRYKIKY
jgi:hypothetical protein